MQLRVERSVLRAKPNSDHAFDHTFSGNPRKISQLSSLNSQLHESGLEYTGLSETVISAAAWVSARPSDDHVIQQLDIDRTRGFAKLAGQLKISRARRRIATRSIVRTDHRTCCFTNDFAKNLSRMRQSRRRRAGRNLHAPQQPILSIEAQNPKLLDRQSLRDGLEITSHEIGPIEYGRFFDLLRDDAPGDFHHCDQLEGFDATDALQLPEVRFAPADQTRQRSGCGEQTRGQREHILSTRAASDQQREEFRIAEGGRTETLQPLLRTVPDGKLLQPVASGVLRGAGHAHVVRRFTPVANL